VGVGNELLVASKLLGVRCVIHQRGIGPITRWSGWLARRADHVISVSEAARQNLIAQGLAPERCTAIHNGINMKELRAKIRRTASEVRTDLGIAEGKTIVGLAGMIRPWKGQIVLVRAMARLHERYPHVHALILGGIADNDPTDLAYLREIRIYIAEHHLDDCVTILDYQPNAPEFIQVFAVMVHTAIDPEPFSRVVIEGMALGCAIVASNNGGTPEAIHDGVTGLLVPAGDPDALAEKIAWLLEQPELRGNLGRAARQRVEERFLIEKHVSLTEDVYRQIAGKGPTH
jgi:glycosyltransferase involved in cell wall biosynthesis